MINISVQETATDLKIRKLREKSADTNLYTLENHTVERPQTVTMTSNLPTPRKGNPGTVKTILNLRLTDTLDLGSASERNVPVIVKLETSFPVGTRLETRSKAALAIAAFLSQESDVFEEMFYSGMLPIEMAAAVDNNGGHPPLSGDNPR